MYLTSPLQNVTHYENPRRLLFIQTPDPHQYDNMTTASCHSSERNKIFSSLNVFISLDGKCPIIHCLTLLEVHCWSIQLSAAQFCSSFCAWCLAATEKPCKARSWVTTCWTLCVVGWLVGVVGGLSGWCAWCGFFFF